MWKLKIAEGGNPWLRTVNNHVGRQIWEFDPNLGSPEELMEIEKVRLNFTENRFRKKHSSDLLMRFQVYRYTFFILCFFSLMHVLLLSMISIVVNYNKTTIAMCLFALLKTSTVSHSLLNLLFAIFG